MLYKFCAATEASVAHSIRTLPRSAIQGGRKWFALEPPVQHNMGQAGQGFARTP